MALMLPLEEMLGRVLGCLEEVELLRNMAAAVAFVAQVILLQDISDSVYTSDTGLVPTP